MQPKPYLDLLRITEKQAIEIAAELSQGDGSSRRRDNRRIHPRLPFYEDALLLCELKTGRDDAPHYLVKCVDISAGGMGFLHGAYVHVDTACQITLIVRKKTGFRVMGKVARCIHHRGHVHVVGVRFDQPMEAAQIEALKVAP